MFRPHPPSAIPPSSSQPQGEFSLDERRQLLTIAHESILSSFRGSEVIDSANPRFSVKRGVFTTLYLSGQLRGCVGYVQPIVPLYQAVAESARAAAFEDSRFAPVSQQEALQLEISLSVLSELFPIEPEKVEIGLHGLVISRGPYRGLLLPQVPVEHEWDRETFLNQTCRKAGVEPFAWLNGAQVEAFTAEVFGDRDLPG